MPQAPFLTNAGRAKLVSATPEDQLHITHVAVGDGNGGYPVIGPDATALVNEVWRGDASDPIRAADNASQLIFEAVIPADEGGWTLRELGIFDDSDTLIAIGQIAEIQKPIAGESTSLMLTVRFRIQLDNADQVELIAQDVGIVDHQGLVNRDAAGAHPASAIDVTAIPGLTSASDLQSVLAAIVARLP